MREDLERISLNAARLRPGGMVNWTKLLADAQETVQKFKAAVSPAMADYPPKYRRVAAHVPSESTPQAQQQPHQDVLRDTPQLPPAAKVQPEQQQRE